MEKNKLKKHNAIIIGQALPAKDSGIPFAKTRLYFWLESVGISGADFRKWCEFDALVDFFPGKSKSGGDRKPTKHEITQNIPRLTQKIKNCAPQIIIPVGISAIQVILDDEKASLKDCVGKKFFIKPFGIPKRILIIPLPHPSGASPWVYTENNYSLLQKALLEIKDAHETSLE